MATAKSAASTAAPKKTTSTKSAAKTTSRTNTRSAAATSAADPTKAEAAPVKAPVKRVKRFDTNEYVTVKNGFHGTTFYRDTTTGMTYEWNSFGDEVDMTIGELQRARSQQPKFFSENWWLIEDPDVMEFLRVSQFYSNALTATGFEELFDKTPEEIAVVVSELSDGQKLGVVHEAKQRIEDGSLYDVRTIKALEGALSVELIEK